MTSFSRFISAPLASKFNPFSSKAKWLAVAMIALGGSAAEAQTTATFTSPGNQTWTCPTGVTTVQVEVWGGGGGSGGVGAHFASTGGGAGGSYVKVTSVAVTPGTVYQMTVAAGGTAGTGGGGGTNNGGAGGTGGSSYFGNTTAGNAAGALVLAVGGPGSIGNNSTGVSTTNRTATAGATATNSGNIPGTGATANFAGTNGATPVTNANNSGAGGAGAGASGSTGGGAGGGALSSAGNGNAGSAPGGGGGGADQSSSSSNGAGAAGGAGEVALTYTPSSPFITVTGTMTTLCAVQGAASAPTTFSASGNNLTGNISVGAPTGFEVSTSSNSGFGSSVSLMPSGGAVSATTIYVRLAAGATLGNYSGDVVTLTTAGGGTQTIAIPTSSVVTPFTAGNLAVEQLATNGTSSTFSILELSSSTGSQTSPINTFFVPYTGASALRQSNAGSTGRLALSNDQTLLAFAAFEDPTGTADETSITHRGAGSLSQGYQYNLAASYVGTVGTGDQTRGATFNAGSWYMSDKNGVYLNGSTAAANPTNIRPLKSYGGTVYAMSANAGAVVSTVSADGTTLTALPGLPGDSNSVDFYMLSSGVNGSTFDMIYVLDGATVTKYSLVGSSWVSNGTGSLTVTGDGFCASNNGTGAYLYTSTGSVTPSVVRLTDTAGYNAAPSINASSAVTLYSAPAGTFVKGVTFVPLAAALPDLTIAVAAPSQAGTGSPYNYTLTAANSGAASASGVSFEFTLPAGVSFVSAADNGTAGFTATTSTNGAGQTVVKFTDGTLASGATDNQLTVVAESSTAGTYTVDAGNSSSTTDGSAAINTTASTSSPIAESNTANNYPNIATSTTVGSLPDLTVDVGTTASNPLVNSNFTFTVTASNPGNGPATGIPLNFTLPAGLTYVSASEGTVNFTAAAPTVTTGGGQQTVHFTGGSLAANASDTITVTVTSSGIGKYTVAAGAAVINPGDVVTESNYSNDSSTSTPSVTVTASNLVVNTTPMPNSAISPGDTADTFSIYVSNVSATSGGVTSGAVTVTDTLPTGLTPAASMNGTTVNGWTITVSGQTVTATRSGTLNPGQGYPPLVITYSVASNLTGSVTNSVSVSGGGEVTTSNDSGNFGVPNSSTNTITIGTASPLAVPGQLLVTRGHYLGTASTISVGQTLPNGSSATVNGSYPNVWSNETPDVSFGITAPIYMDVINANLSSPVMSTGLSGINVTSLIQDQLGLAVTTSFSSKSELGVFPTPDGKGVTMVGYMAPVNTLDVSNANEPYLVDPTNLIAANGQFQHTIVQMDYLGNVQVTPIDAYSGDNCRGAVLAKASDGNSYYYTAGSAGNSGSGVTGAIMSMLANCTGIQMILPGAGGLTTPVGEPFGTYGSSTGYQLGYQGQPSDKTGKDMNLRGLALNPFTNTLYSSKGSGGQGVDTVYQIGSGLPTAANANTKVITIPTGFPTTSNGHYPFGMWFASPSILYVSDEGEAPSAVTYDGTGGTYDEALPLNNPFAGLEKWVNSQPDGSGTWSLAYTLQAGLNLGVPYSYTIGNGYPAPGTLNSVTGVPWQPANNGLRTFAAKLNGDGTATFYAITSTVSGETDWGADPNQLVTITDNVAATTLPGSESFSVLEEAGGLDCLRGVSLFQGAPVNPVTATNVTSSGATLNGEVNPNGTDAQVYFQYGTSTSYGSSTTEQDMGSGTSPVSFSTTLGGLLPTMVYYYREVTVINGVTTYYAGQSFTTPAGSGGTISNEVDTPTMPPAALVILAMALMGYAFHSTRRREA